MTSTTEDGVVTINAPGAKGNISIMANESQEGGVITLDKAHIAGPGAGNSSVAELRRIVQDYGRSKGADRVVINPATRTTGLHQGKAMRQIIVDIPKSDD